MSKKNLSNPKGVAKSRKSPRTLSEMTISEVISEAWQRGKAGEDRRELGTEAWLGMMAFVGILIGILWAGA